MQNIKLVVCKGFEFQKRIFTLQYKVTLSPHQDNLERVFLNL